MRRSRRQWGEDSTMRVDLSAGASVVLIFKGNLFQLTADERRLMGDLTATIQRYLDTQELEQAKAPADGPFVEQGAAK